MKQNLTVLAVNWQKYLNMVDWDRLAMTILEKVLLLIL
ncbi:mechanosensitive ion channel family protein, partial [Lactobacillus parabuchneri]|nr:mechanosensitive ion channel family protein [Lentilactobacillus parabuchneri]